MSNSYYLKVDFDDIENIKIALKYYSIIFDKIDNKDIIRTKESLQKTLDKLKGLRKCK